MAMDSGFLPAQDEDQDYMFTPSELCLYQHAHDHRLLTKDILGCPSIFDDILGYPWYQKLSCFQVDSWGFKEESLPAAAVRQPGGEMNEMDGMRTSEGISQDNSVSNYYPGLSQIIQVWQSYPNLSLDMQV